MINDMELEWLPMQEPVPSNVLYVLVFSPCYPVGDSMRIRIVDAQFLNILTDAERWAVIPEPQEIQE